MENNHHILYPLGIKPTGLAWRNLADTGCNQNFMQKGGTYQNLVQIIIIWWKQPELVGHLHDLVKGNRSFLPCTSFNLLPPAKTPPISGQSNGKQPCNRQQNQRAGSRYCKLSKYQDVGILRFVSNYRYKKLLPYLLQNCHSYIKSAKQFATL